MYRTRCFNLASSKFSEIDSELSAEAAKGFGVISGPVYLPTRDGPGALIYTLADLRGEELPKPEIVPAEPQPSEEADEAVAHFDSRRAQSE